MSTLSKKDVERIAQLARLELNEEEVDRYQKEMSAILSYVEKLSELDTDGVEPIGHITGMINRYREDVEESENDAERSGIMKNVPQVKRKCIVVKKVL